VETETVLVAVEVVLNGNLMIQVKAKAVVSERVLVVVRRMVASVVVLETKEVLAAIGLVVDVAVVEVLVAVGVVMIEVEEDLEDVVEEDLEDAAEVTVVEVVLVKIGTSIIVLIQIVRLKIKKLNLMTK
jgi:hypothetical protein